MPQPLRAVTGDWVAQGWTAWSWVAGAAADWSGVSPRWPELIAVQIRRLLPALRPVDLPDQLIHADLMGNVLFADGLPPAVIDFSPLRRPAGLPLAIVALDALMWQRARPEVLGQLADEPEIDQLLAHALVYRLVTEIVMHAGTPGIDMAGQTGQPVTDLLLARLGR